jgi:hypothetical protein
MTFMDFSLKQMLSEYLPCARYWRCAVNKTDLGLPYRITLQIIIIATISSKVEDFLNQK